MLQLLVTTCRHRGVELSFSFREAEKDERRERETPQRVIIYY
jgi:hypothetical protein